MHHKPLIVINPHSVTITPTAFDLLRTYTHFFIHDRQTKLEHYRAQPDEAPHDTIQALRSELEQAQALVKALEPTKEQFLRIYELNFVNIADALRQARVALELTQIEQMHSLKIVLFYLMKMLKEENPLFSPEKFIQHINERN